MKIDVFDIMKSIFNRPMTSDTLSKKRCTVVLYTANIIMRRIRNFIVMLNMTFYTNHSLYIFPLTG